ncbi:MAG: hypothetical protein ACLTZM_20090 [Ruminococcus sp.]
MKPHLWLRKQRKERKRNEKQSFNYKNHGYDDGWATMSAALQQAAAERADSETIKDNQPTEETADASGGR